MSARSRHMLLLAASLAVVFVGAHARLHRLDAQGLWMDEYITEERLHWPLAMLCAQRPATLAYHLILKSYHGLVQRLHQPALSPYMLRLPFAVAGVAGLLVMWALGRAVAGASAGLLAAGMTALSGFHVHYAREARYYPFFFLFAALAVLAAWTCVRTSARRMPWRPYAWLAVCITLGLGIHRGFYFLGAVLTVYLAAFETLRAVALIRRGMRPAATRRLAVVFAFLALPALLWSPVLLAAAADTRATLSQARAPATALPSFSLHTLADVQRSFVLQPGVLRDSLPFLVLAAGLLVLCTRGRHVAWWWALGLLLPVYYLSHAASRHAFHAKYLSYLLVLTILLLSVATVHVAAGCAVALARLRGCHRPARLARNGQLIAALFVLAVLATAAWTNREFYLRFYRANQHNGDARLIAFLDRAVQPHDLLVFHEEPWRPPALPPWVRYFLRAQPRRRSWNALRAVDFSRALPPRWTSPLSVWWVMGYPSPADIDQPPVHAIASATRFGNRMLLRARTRYSSRAALRRDTAALYTAYGAGSSNPYLRIYTTIASELE